MNRTTSLVACFVFVACSSDTAFQPFLDATPSDAAADSGGSDTSAPDTFVAGDELPPTWQRQIGVADLDAISSANESTQGLAARPGGGVFAFADRRYQSDPNRREAYLYEFDDAGTVRELHLLQFERNVSPLSLVSTDSALYATADIEELSVLRINLDGTLAWSRRLEREPFAFGGLNASDTAVDSEGAVYVVGGFNPSEGNDDRGFLIKLNPDGTGAWFISWPHESFFDDLRVALSDDIVYVADAFPGTNEMSSQSPGLLSFDAGSGSPVASVSFVYSVGTETAPAIRDMDLVPAEGGGIDVIGARAISRDGEQELVLLNANLDPLLALQSATGARIPTDDAVFASAVRAERLQDGGIALLTRVEDRLAVVEFGTDGVPRSALDLVGADGATPLLEEDDFPEHLSVDENGALHLAATADTPGPTRLVPRAIGPFDFPLDVVPLGLTFSADMLVVSEGNSYTLGTDERAVLDEQEAGDEDVLLLQLRAD